MRSHPSSSRLVEEGNIVRNAVLCDFQLGVFRNHLFQTIRDEADGELEIVAGTLAAKDSAVAVFGVLDARAESPCPRGSFPGFGFIDRTGLRLASAQHFHNGVDGVVAAPAVFDGRLAAAFAGFFYQLIRD